MRVSSWRSLGLVESLIFVQLVDTSPLFVARYFIYPTLMNSILNAKKSRNGLVDLKISIQSETSYHGWYWYRPLSPKKYPLWRFRRFKIYLVFLFYKSRFIMSFVHKININLLKRITVNYFLLLDWWKLIKK